MFTRPILLTLLFMTPVFGFGNDNDAKIIVRDAINHWRGHSSYTEMTIVIHRPKWERSMSMRAWTKGDDHYTGARNWTQERSR